MKWCEVVDEVEALAPVAAPVAAAVVARAAWAVPRLPGPVVTASAPVAGIGNRTWWVCPVIRRSARSAARG